MANLIEKAKLFQKVLDQQVAAESVTAYMEPAAATVQYNGGDTVKMPTLDGVSGLASYSRTSGYVMGDFSLTYTDYQLTQDRGRKFMIDAMDVDESAFLATAGNVLAEFQRTQVIPEIDAYRLASIAGKAVAAGQTSDSSSIADDMLLDALLDDLAAIRDRLKGTGAVLKVHMSTITQRRLSNSKRATNFFGSRQIGEGGGTLQTRINTVDDADIVITQQSLLNTGITVSATNGWAPTVGQKRVNWLITAVGAPIAVSKTDLPRIFDPLTNQAANAWLFDYRKFHDLWVPKNKMAGVHVSTGATIA